MDCGTDIITFFSCSTYNESQILETVKLFIYSKFKNKRQSIKIFKLLKDVKGFTTFYVANIFNIVTGVERHSARGNKLFFKPENQSHIFLKIPTKLDIFFQYS